jgi:glycosyltransferase involved in cell wall biosynthesis
MRVLHVYKDYFPVLGGIENHVRLLAEEQARRGLDVTVLVTSPEGPEVVEVRAGVRVIKAARLATIASTPLSLGLFGWVRRLDADVAHLHFPYPVGEVAHLLLGRAQRIVITYHSDVVRQRGILRIYRPLLWRVLRHADRIIATSPNYVTSSPYLSRLADRCTVVPLGIDLSPFLSLSRGAREHPDTETRRHGEAETESDLTASPRPPVSPSLRLLFVGRLRYYKGLQYLLRAMADIDAWLMVVGSGPMQAEWQALASELGLVDRVTFLGEVPDAGLPAYYHAADVFVLPACERSEAFGTVQIEAMAAGLPVVCTELGTGTSFVNRDGETGFVVPPRDPAALAQAINRLLADASLRQRFGQAGRQRAECEFSHTVMADRVIALYQQLLAT